jgi:hypothetical protein
MAWMNLQAGLRRGIRRPDEDRALAEETVERGEVIRLSIGEVLSREHLLHVKAPVRSHRVLHVTKRVYREARGARGNGLGPEMLPSYDGPAPQAWNMSEKHGILAG